MHIANLLSGHAIIRALQNSRPFSLCLIPTSYTQTTSLFILNLSSTRHAIELVDHTSYQLSKLLITVVLSQQFILTLYTQ